LAHMIDIAASFGLRARALVAMTWLSPVATAALLDDFLAAADRGQCVEGVTYRMIRERGPANAAHIVEAALEAHTLRARQQRDLGCKGNIAAQAIAAGADPDQVLEATAAGL